MNKLTCIVLHWTWCLPQTLLGWIVYRWVKFRDKNCIVDKCFYKNGYYAVMTKSEKFPGGISLGRYVFTNMLWGDVSYRHEFGHSVQSLILGPLYLIIIGIPSSMFAANITMWVKKSYYWFYTEKWADSIMDIDDDRDRKHGNQRPGAFWKKRNREK